MKQKITERGTRPAVKNHARRCELIGKTADLLLFEGVAQIPLRQLAKRLGTSDRMLLYYFDDKADLVRTTIMEVSSRLGAVLASSMSNARRSPAQMLAITVRLLVSPRLSPFMNVWADISARGGRGEEPFRTIARHSVARWLEWLDKRLAVTDAGTRRSIASALFVVMEGVRLTESAAPGASRGVAAFLSGSFGASRKRKSAPA